LVDNGSVVFPDFEIMAAEKIMKDDRSATEVLGQIEGFLQSKKCYQWV